MDTSELLAGLSDDERATVLDGLSPEELAQIGGAAEGGGSSGEPVAGEGATGEGAAGASDPTKGAAAKITDGAADPGKDAGKTAAKTAAESDDDDDADPGATKGPPPTHVSFRKWAKQRDKLTEANTRAEALAKEAQELREKFARGDERLRLLAEAMNPPGEKKDAKQEDPEPDPAQDLIAWAQWSQREMARLRQGQTTQAETFQADVTERTMREDYQRDAVAFAQATPDFMLAYNYLLQTRAGMLAALGYGEQEIRQTLHEEEKSLVQRAKQTNKRPSEVMYSLARQMGWKPEMAKPSTDPDAAAAAGGNGAGNGVAATNGAGNGKAPSVADEIARIAAGQAASKSLSGAGGSGGQELNLEALAAMSDKEFQALYAKRKVDIDKLMGAAN